MSTDVLRLYRPSAKDLATGMDTWLKRYTRELTASAVAASVSGIDTAPVPGDTVRYIEQMMFFWQPGAAQTPTGAVVWASDVANAVIVGVLGGAQQDGVAVAAAAHRRTLPIGFYMFPGEIVNFAATFNAGAANNQFTVFLSGWEFPRGTVQR